MLRYLTAGESHGEMLVGILEGLPAGVPVTVSDIDRYLARRQGGYGRGGRQKIERDHAQLVAGIRAGETLGSPVAILVANRDWKNWQGVMNADPGDIDPERVRKRQVTAPRPGHADLAGGLKYDRSDLRDVLERASARETAIRVALGAVCLKFLRELGVSVAGHVVSIGTVRAMPSALDELSCEEIARRAAASLVYCADEFASRRMVETIREAMRRNDTLGGEVEVRVEGLPVGLGSHVDPSRRLDARLAGGLMGIQAVKGVEVGLGFAGARAFGSEVHDPITYRGGNTLERSAGYARTRNGAGGLEGGITNGAPLVVRIAMKPLSTLTRPLPSVDIRTKARTGAAVERTDVTAVPALSVVAEAVVGLVLADAFLEKFGGDSLGETRRNLEGYLAQLRRHPGRPAQEEAEPPDPWVVRAVRAAAARADKPGHRIRSRVARRRSGPNLVLIGLPGTGKSALAAAVASATGAPFVDTDAIVVRRAKKPIEDIFRDDGEEAFRRLEEEAVESVPPYTATIVATGGGVPCLPENREWLRAGGLVVWLRGSLAELERRLLASETPRPLLPSKDGTGSAAAGDLARALARLEAERSELYRSMSDVVVEVDGQDVAALAASLSRIWKDAGHHATRFGARSDPSPGGALHV